MLLPELDCFRCSEDLQLSMLEIQANCGVSIFNIASAQQLFDSVGYVR